MRFHHALGISAVAVLSCAKVYPATIRAIDIEHDAGVYRLESTAYLAAPREEIYEVLTDYDRFGRISSTYTDYGFLEPAADGTPVIHTTMEGCVLFFCVTMRRVERMELDAPRYIRTEAFPEQSDFKVSISEWTLEPEADGTRMTYSLTVEPDFWVPPLIGPWALKQRLERGGSGAINRIERIARAAASLPIEER